MAQDHQRQRKLKPIITNSGFRCIAKAIRQGTVTPQRLNTKQGDRTYDIRYGLAEELHRRSRDNLEFMRALGKFVQEFNWENARAQDRQKKTPSRTFWQRTTIADEDIAQVAELVDEYDAPTIASLLIAFGYAREKTFDGSNSSPSESTLDTDDSTASETEDDVDEPFSS